MKKISEERLQHYKNKLQEEVTNKDIEGAHCEADDLLCSLLTELGLKDIVEIYDNVHKWYA